MYYFRVSANNSNNIFAEVIVCRKPERSPGQGSTPAMIAARRLLSMTRRISCRLVPIAEERSSNDKTAFGDIEPPHFVLYAQSGAVHKPAVFDFSGDRLHFMIFLVCVYNSADHRIHRLDMRIYLCFHDL